MIKNPLKHIIRSPVAGAVRDIPKVLNPCLSGNELGKHLDNCVIDHVIVFGKVRDLVFPYIVSAKSFFSRHTDQAYQFIIVIVSRNRGITGGRRGERVSSSAPTPVAASAPSAGVSATATTTTGNSTAAAPAARPSSTSTAGWWIRSPPAVAFHGVQ